MNRGKFVHEIFQERKMRIDSRNEDKRYIHRVTDFGSFGWFLYDGTNEENCIPDFSLRLRTSSLFRNSTNSTSARILLLQIVCHSRKESV